MRLSRIIAIVAILAGGILSGAAGVSKQELINKYRSQLPGLTNARDSVKTLYYLYDLSDRNGQKNIAWQIYETAGRAEDLNSQMDMLRNLAVFNYKNDSIIKKLQTLADKIPNEDARSATKTFIFNQQVSSQCAIPEDSKLSSMLLDSIINSHNLQGNNIYDRIALLYQIIQYIGVESEGSLFVECLDKYASMIDQLPESDFPLKNQFYVTSAQFHSRPGGDQRRAVIYDRKLLEITDMLKQMYMKQNRTHRNYDDLRFVSYRRILSNFKVLSQAEIEETYDSLMMLRERNSDVRRTLDSDHRVYAYYHYAKGEYKEALEAIKKALAYGNTNVYQRIKLYDMLINTAKKLGDRNTLLDAMENYIKEEQLVDSMRRITNQREIMLRNSISNAPLLTEYSSAKTTRKTKGVEIALIVISSLLALTLTVYMILYIRLKRKTRKCY